MKKCLFVYGNHDINNLFDADPSKINFHGQWIALRDRLQSKGIKKLSLEKCDFRVNINTVKSKLVDSLKNVLKETGTLEGVGWDLEDLDDLASITQEPLEVEDAIVIKIGVGKYKAEVSKEKYDEWLIMVQKQVGKDKEDIIQWIVEQLQIEIV